MRIQKALSFDKVSLLQYPHFIRILFSPVVLFVSPSLGSRWLTVALGHQWANMKEKGGREHKFLICRWAQLPLNKADFLRTPPI